MPKHDIQKILVVVRQRDDGEIVLDKAARIATRIGAVLHCVRIVHDEFAELSIHGDEKCRELKSFLIKSEDTLLEELVAPLRKAGAVVVETETIWHKYEWQGVIELANQCGANLIVKGTDYPAQEVIRTPSDWNLLRYADMPVMLLKPINWSATPTILAAVDVNAGGDDRLNTRILRRGKQLCEALNGTLHIVNAFPSVERWVGPVTIAIDFEQVRRQVGAEIARRVQELVAATDVTAEKVHTQDGECSDVLQRVVQETGADMLVMGTHQRTGPKGVLMGNTSEKILHTVKCDVEVLH